MKTLQLGPVIRVIRSGRMLTIDTNQTTENLWLTLDVMGSPIKQPMKTQSVVFHKTRYSIRSKNFVLAGTRQSSHAPNIPKLDRVKENDTPQQVSGHSNIFKVGRISDVPKSLHLLQSNRCRAAKVLTDVLASLRMPLEQNSDLFMEHEVDETSSIPKKNG